MYIECEAISSLSFQSGEILEEYQERKGLREKSQKGTCNCGSSSCGWSLV